VRALVGAPYRCITSAFELRSGSSYGVVSVLPLETGTTQPAGLIFAVQTQRGKRHLSLYGNEP